MTKKTARREQKAKEKQQKIDEPGLVVETENQPETPAENQPETPPENQPETPPENQPEKSNPKPKNKKPKPKPKKKQIVRAPRRTPNEIALGIGEIEGSRKLDAQAILDYRKNNKDTQQPDTVDDTQQPDTVDDTQEPHKPEKVEKDDDGVREYNPKAFDPSKDSILNLSGMTSNHKFSRDFVIFKVLIKVIFRIKSDVEATFFAQVAAPVVAHMVGGSGPNIFFDGGIFVVAMIGRKIGWIPDPSEALREFAMEMAKEKAQAITEGGLDNGESAIDSILDMDANDLKDILQQFAGGVSKGDE